MCHLTDKIKRINLLRHERILFDFLKSKGIPTSQIQKLPDTFADRKPVKGEAYFYYDGPLDEKTRAFCKKMLSLDKVVSESDIDVLSIELQYDVLKYKGSYNCRHRWVRFRGKRILTPELTNRQISDLIRRGIHG